MTLSMYRVIAKCYKRKKMYDAAISEFKKAIEKDPTYAKAYYSLGRLYFDLDRLQEAEDTARKVLEINPQFINGYLLLGYIYYYKQGEADKAIVEYEKVLEIDPKEPYALTNMGTIYEEKGERQKAITYYEKAIEAHPNHSMVQTAKKNLDRLTEEGQEK